MLAMRKIMSVSLVGLLAMGAVSGCSGTAKDKTPDNKAQSVEKVNTVDKIAFHAEGVTDKTEVLVVDELGIKDTPELKKIPADLQKQKLNHVFIGLNASEAEEAGLVDAMQEVTRQLGYNLIKEQKEEKTNQEMEIPPNEYKEHSIKIYQPESLSDSRVDVDIASAQEFDECFEKDFEADCDTPEAHKLADELPKVNWVLNEKQKEGHSQLFPSDENEKEFNKVKDKNFYKKPKVGDADEFAVAHVTMPWVNGKTMNVAHVEKGKDGSYKVETVTLDMHKWTPTQNSLVGWQLKKDSEESYSFRTYQTFIDEKGRVIAIPVEGTFTPHKQGEIIYDWIKWTLTVNNYSEEAPGVRGLIVG